MCVNHKYMQLVSSPSYPHVSHPSPHRAQKPFPPQSSSPKIKTNEIIKPNIISCSISIYSPYPLSARFPSLFAFPSPSFLLLLPRPLYLLLLSLHFRTLSAHFAPWTSYRSHSSVMSPSLLVSEHRGTGAAVFLSTCTCGPRFGGIKLHVPARLGYSFVVL